MVDKEKADRSGIGKNGDSAKAKNAGDVKHAGSSRFASALAGLANIPSRPAVPAPVIVERTRFTPEQEAFLASNDPHLLLSALAGAGKTECLFEYARRRPHQKWNFLVLNRDLVDILARRAPSNVKVSTLHKVAFAAHGHLLASKLREGVVPAKAIEKCLGRRSLPEGFVSALRQGFEAFLSSDDLSPGLRHAPLAWTADPNWDPQEWTSAMEKIWASSLDPDDPLPISHAVYLKRYTQQQTPWLSPRWMLDEAQDWPDSVLSAFRRCARISIRAGDPCQRLYAFRGASLGQWHDPQHEKEFRLAQSHRASSQLEPYVNAVLSRLPGNWQWKGRADMDCNIDLRAGPASVESIEAFAPDVILADRWKPLDLLASELSGMTISRKESLVPGGVEISTIHSAKGREFGKVWLHDQAISQGLSPVLASRLLYVAITRARNAISFPEKMVALPQQQTVDLGQQSLDFFFNPE